MLPAALALPLLHEGGEVAPGQPQLPQQAALPHLPPAPQELEGAVRLAQGELQHRVEASVVVLDQVLRVKGRHVGIPVVPAHLREPLVKGPLQDRPHSCRVHVQIHLQETLVSLNTTETKQLWVSHIWEGL